MSLLREYVSLKTIEKCLTYENFIKNVCPNAAKMILHECRINYIIYPYQSKLYNKATSSTKQLPKNI